MKGWIILVVMGLFLAGFIVAAHLTGNPIENSDGVQSQLQNRVGLSSDNETEDNETEIDDENETLECEAWTCTKWSACVNDTSTRTCTRVANCTNEEETPKLSKNCREKERLWKNRSFDCPEDCTCTGSTVKCMLINGRIMTIYAGKSGNVIIQVKGENMTTNVTLYKADGKVYGTFRGNMTKEIKMLPDQVRERMRERIMARLQSENITLDDYGVYRYEAKKRARLFLIFPVAVPVRAEIDPETGEIIRLKTRWWSFLARDEQEAIVGASCGTVTPGQNDACCQMKGYDVWNAESQQCEFNADK